MTDDRVLAYLRDRATAKPPHDFVTGVSDAVAGVQQRSLRLMSVLPAAAAVAVAAAVTALALLTQQSQDVGPMPESSAATAPAASTTEAPSATAQEAGESLVERGEVVVMPAIDDEGQWGTIRLERGDELVPSDPEWSSFDDGSVIIEIHVRYIAERASNQSAGTTDWGVRMQDGIPGTIGADILPATWNPARSPSETLGSFQAAEDGSVMEGWIALEVPVLDRSPAVYLTYQGGERPSGMSQAPVWEVLVRERSRSAPPAEGADLLIPGDAALVPAIGPEGRFGTITIDRGPDVGGYRSVAAVDLDPEDPDPPSMFFPNDPASFYVEILVRYDLDRAAAMPPLFGRSDWRIQVETDVGRALVEPISVGVGGPRELYDTSPDVIVVNPEMVVEGWLVFPVPRDAADQDVTLVYAPASADDVRLTLRARAPGPAPDHLPTVDPPKVATYRQIPETSITVAADAEADELFVEPDTCTNPVAGYTVAYPDSWYTNTAVGDTPACSWFSPVFFEVADPARTPTEVGITMEYRAEAGGIGGLGQPIYAETLEVDGRPANRNEQVGTGGGFLPLGSFRYTYTVAPSGTYSDGETLEPILFATANWLPTDAVRRYELDRAVLDRIMASFQFTD